MLKIFMGSMHGLHAEKSCNGSSILPGAIFFCIDKSFERNVGPPSLIAVRWLDHADTLADR
jgi:hypothetical protein